jgi:hypothetical protein
MRCYEGGGGVSGALTAVNGDGNKIRARYRGWKSKQDAAKEGQSIDVMWS